MEASQSNLEESRRHSFSSLTFASKEVEEGGERGNNLNLRSITPSQFVGTKGKIPPGEGGRGWASRVFPEALIAPNRSSRPQEPSQKEQLYMKTEE